MNDFLRNTVAKTVATGVMLLTSTSLVIAAGNTVSFEQPDKGIDNIGGLITAGINAAIIIAALLTFIFLIWGGIQWLTSGGDKSAYEAARGRITAALIGLAIVASAWALMKIIGVFFDVDITSGDLDFGTADTAAGASE